eukprot:1034591-Prymnesium_polylepis.2
MSATGTHGQTMNEGSVHATPRPRVTLRQGGAWVRPGSGPAGAGARGRGSRFGASHLVLSCVFVVGDLACEEVVRKDHEVSQEEGGPWSGPCSET